VQSEIHKIKQTQKIWQQKKHFCVNLGRTVHVHGISAACYAPFANPIEKVQYMHNKNKQLKFCTLRHKHYKFVDRTRLYSHNTWRHQVHVCVNESPRQISRLDRKFRWYIRCMQQLTFPYNSNETKWSNKNSELHELLLASYTIRM